MRRGLGREREFPAIIALPSTFLIEVLRMEALERLRLQPLATLCKTEASQWTADAVRREDSPLLVAEQAGK
jgi:hypothetical protein